MTLLKAENISKTVKNGKNEVKILDDVSLEIEKGSFTVIMGSSGAGKSTLLYALSGTDKISSGKIIFNGQEILSDSEKVMAKVRSQSFGFVFQEANLISNLTLKENVAVSGFLKKDRSEKETLEKVEELFEKMNLQGAALKFPYQTSGGENQRCAIARSVVNEPEILFADEPTGALNRANSDEVMKLFTELNAGGQTILMVTHDLKTAIRGEKIIYIDDGKINGSIELGKFEDGNEKEREASLSKWLWEKGW
ncbi:MAG: ABC transporter ATP-binding protein [Bacilli bacterium]|nr:ABC transporter ATP-binding protein [Bacilli bacterium]